MAKKAWKPKGVAIFAKACFWHPSPSKRQKLNATANACGCPSRPASLVLYPTRGIKLVYAMTRRDVGMLCIFTPQKTLRENAQPYRFWGLLGFPPRSEGIIKQRFGIMQLDHIFR